MDELLVYVGGKGRFHVLDDNGWPVCQAKYRMRFPPLAEAVSVEEALEGGATPCNGCRWNPAYREWGQPALREDS